MTDTVTGLSDINKVKALSKSAKAKSTVSQSSATSDSPQVDKVNLTHTVETLEKLSASLAEGSVVDKQKVEHLKKLIESGEYKINADSIAQKLVELEKSLRKKG